MVARRDLQVNSAIILRLLGPLVYWRIAWTDISRFAAVVLRRCRSSHLAGTPNTDRLFPEPKPQELVKSQIST